MKLCYATVCSGIDAPAAAWNPIGWQQVFCSEIEPFPSSVLKHHHPKVPNYGDMTHYAKWPSHKLDVLIGGTPCQSFSVAGLRKGLADPRGNLALTFLAIVERYAPTWVVWENVPGVFSSWSDVTSYSPGEESRRVGNTATDLATSLGFDYDTARKFGAFEEVDQSNDLDCFTAGLGKLGYGWALASLDAQYFGVAQRRERVFVVGHIGGQWQRAAAVLFDRESLCGNPPPRRETGERIAPSIAARTRGGGGLGTDAECDGAVIPIQEIGKRQTGTAMNGVGHGQPGDPMFTLQKSAEHGVAISGAEIAETLRNHPRPGSWNVGLTIPVGIDGGEVGFALRSNASHSGDKGDGGVNTTLVASTLRSCSNTKAGHSARADGFDGSEDGTGRGTPIVVAHGQGNAEMVKDGSPSLTCNHEAPILFDTTQITSPGNYSNPKPGDPSHPLANGQHPPAIAFPGRMSGTQRATATELPPSIGTANPTAVSHGGRHSSSMDVRRLTPRECERLQGFPDDYTLIDYRGKPAVDGPRYKALGNSMAVPVIRWIGERIEMVESL